ncbi:hypothetical protein Tco_0426672, partial [Tanacetum coccineum]
TSKAPTFVKYGTPSLTLPSTLMSPDSDIATARRDSTLAIWTFMISSGLSDDPSTKICSSLATIARTNGVSKLSVALEDVYVFFTDPKPLPSATNCRASLWSFPASVTYCVSSGSTCSEGQYIKLENVTRKF